MIVCRSCKTSLVAWFYWFVDNFFERIFVEHQQHRISLPVLQANFPTTGKFKNGPWKGQEEIMSFIAGNGASIIESPTGTGKTAVEYAFLKASELRGAKLCFLIAPNKTIVDQISQEFPELKVVLGRHEYDCLHPLYKDKVPLPLADEIPCLMLDCPHRVDQTTGQIQEEGATPCPYYQAKFEAKQGNVVVSTMAFYLFTTLFSKDGEATGALVIDEAHRIAEVVRNCLSYEITDFHLRQSIKLLRHINAEEVKVIGKFLGNMKKIAKKKADRRGVLLDPPEIRRLISILEEIDSNALLAKIKQAIKERVINPREDMTTLKRLEVLVRDLRRYVHSFEYSLETDQRKPLNYTCAYYQQEVEKGKKTQHKLVIKCYYVAPLIRKILPPLTVSFSATIGNPEIFGYETGIRSPSLSLDSSFPVDNTRIYLPKDTPDLSVNNRSKRDLTQILRKIAKACKRFSKKGIRCLVVTISNIEREKFLMLATEEGVNAISYGNGVTAKEAAQQFKDGQGQVLVGTAANYSEGIDLPRQTAPVIFFLRPGYPNPKDPSTIFEERRFGGQRWALWNWRVMQQALQVRGRNIRRFSDTGVTFFISQQFKRILFGALPDWLQKSYRNQFTFEEALTDAEKLLE